MQVGNYCKECGHRIHPNEYFCTGCGCKTGYDSKNSDYVFTPPIHDIGFFDFDIDFYPYIDSKNDCTYEICSCGYLNHKDNEFCYMCGAKRSQSRLSKILKRKSKPVFSVDNVLCECGAVNSKENVFCEMCGRQLKDDKVIEKDNFSNFNLEFEDSIFCFCGEENERYSRFCRNCGMDLPGKGTHPGNKHPASFEWEEKPNDPLPGQGGQEGKTLWSAPSGRIPRQSAQAVPGERDIR